MAEPYKHIYKVDLNQQMVRRDVGLLATFDSKANRFGAKLYRDGLEVDVSSYTVNGYFIRPDDQTVPITGTAEGNLVYVDLLPGCYLLDGAFEFSLKIKLGDEELAVLMCYGTVERSRTDATAEGGDVVVTVTNAEMLGGKPPEAYTAVNLLDNPDFAVAQAGYNGLHGNVLFHADRWEGTGNGSLSVSGAVKTFTSDSGFAIMKQNLWNDGRDHGKTYTLVVTLSDGTRLAGNGVAPSAASTGEQVFIDITAPDSRCWFMAMKDAGDVMSVRVDASQSGAAVSFLCIDLFEGVYTAINAPAHVPPDPTLELAKCRRYYKKLKYLAVRPYNVATSTRYYRIAIEPPMYEKVRPSIDISESIETPLNSWTDTGAAFVVADPDPTKFNVSATGAASGSDFVLRVDVTICSDIK